jgi:hypothetical protein
MGAILEFVRLKRKNIKFEKMKILKITIISFVLKKL